MSLDEPLHAMTQSPAGLIVPLRVCVLEYSLKKLARNDTKSQNYEITKGPAAKNCHSTESVK